MAGGAVMNAAKLMRDALVSVAADMLASPDAEIDIAEGFAFRRGDETRRLSMRELAEYIHAHGLQWKFESSFTFDKSEHGTGPVLSFGAQLVELDVNVQTGDVRVQNVTFVADPGRVLNPLIFEGQVDGGVVMGLGYALSEDYVPGEAINFKTYGLPTIKQAPAKIELIVVENPVEGAPFGIKGAAETTCVGGMPSVANAIADATGVRLYEMPARPGRVLAALQASAQKPEHKRS
jgi:CO/xanthine dehydrogenase Mo-binding subunit